MREVIKVYRYRCDEGGTDRRVRCTAVFEVEAGSLPYPMPKRVETAADADDTVRANGWRYRGSKAYCPMHAGGRR